MDELTEFEKWVWANGGRYSIIEICRMHGMTREEVTRAYDRAFDVYTKQREIRRYLKRIWTDEDIQILIDRYNKGWSFRHIADELDVDPDRVKNKIRKLQIERVIEVRFTRRTSWSIEDDKKLLELYGSGMSMRQIGEQMNRTHKAVIEHLKIIGEWKGNRNG